MFYAAAPAATMAHMTPAPPPADRRFATTRWSLVAAAGRADAPDGRAALADLCRLYWYPLYAYVRRRGHAAHDAADLTQAFFARLLEKGALGAADPARGRFRTFLLTACQHFLANEHQREAALKRGAGRVAALDLGDAEGRYGREPAHGESPERLFARRWALELLGRALARLRQEHEGEGKGALFEALKGRLTGDDAAGYADVAAALGLSEGAVKTAAHRLRRRYGELLREEIGETVATAAEIDEEVRELFRALG